MLLNILPGKCSLFSVPESRVQCAVYGWWPVLGRSAGVRGNTSRAWGWNKKLHGYKKIYKNTRAHWSRLETSQQGNWTETCMQKCSKCGLGNFRRQLSSFFSPSFHVTFSFSCSLYHHLVLHFLPPLAFYIPFIISSSFVSNIYPTLGIK